MEKNETGVVSYHAEAPPGSAHRAVVAGTRRALPAPRMCSQQLRFGYCCG